MSAGQPPLKKHKGGLKVDVNAPTAEVGVPKSPLDADLHDDTSPSLKFLEYAVNHGASDDYFNNKQTAFGQNDEAFVRDSYPEIKDLIKENWEKSKTERRKKHLAIVKGSSGVGKSVFLAYWIASCRKEGIGDFLIFHAGKGAKNGSGEVDFNEVKCSLFLNAKVAAQGRYPDFRNDLENSLLKVNMIIMDGCSMRFDLSEFKGLVVLAASPSQYVKNLEDTFADNNVAYVMPPVSSEEATQMAKVLQADEAIVTDNFEYMNGIVRYLFREGSAKRQVDKAAPKVNPTNIEEMVSMQSSSKNLDQVAVHSLILWTVKNKKYQENPGFRIVSRYAERLIAMKLAKLELHYLRKTCQTLSYVPGACGYAGALFEACAINVLKDGGTFPLRRLEGRSATTRNLTLDEMAEDQLVVLEGNDLSPASVSSDKLKGKGWPGKPLLLWPKTTNFPTFDCFYLHQNETVYCLQMTISKEHGLNNSGAQKAKTYFDALLGRKKPKKYMAVFVVPGGMASAYKKQKFESTGIKNPPPGMGAKFEQWVLGIDLNSS